MRLLYLFIFLILIATVSAVDLPCQYTETEFYAEIIPQLHDVRTGEVVGPPLIIDNFGRDSMGFVTFQVHNPLDVDITIEIEYTQIVSSGASHKSERVVPIPKNSYVTLQSQHGYDSRYGTSIPIETIKYRVIEPTEMVVQNDHVRKSREICKICAGKTCLDDGQSCANSAQCGAGVCNIAGKCGDFVACPDGLLNCNNQSCLSPSIKSAGEGYACEWECKSGIGESGVCKNPPLPMQVWAMIIVGFISIILFITAYQYFWGKLAKIRKEVEKSNRELSEAQTQAGNLRNKIKNQQKQKQSLTEHINEDKRKIAELNKKIENAKGVAKERFQSELKKIEKHQSQEISELEHKERYMLEKQKELKAQIKQRDDLYKELKEKYWREMVARYGGGEITKDEQGYPIFTRSKERIHRQRYRKKFGIPSGYQVHHIDINRMNANLWNLIALSENDHNKINNENITEGDWNEGIAELMRALNLKEKDLPKHIRDHIKKK